MTINVTPHLNFRGDAREALEFYNSVFGGEITVATYADFGAPQEMPGADKVVFGQVVAENGFRVMAYDIPFAEPHVGSEVTTRRENNMTITEEPFFLTLGGESAEEITALWEKLSEGATIVEPLAQSQWASLFGMLTDRFGVTWIVQLQS